MDETQVFNEYKRGQFVALVATGRSVSEVSELLGVSRATVYRALESDDDFAADYEKAKAGKWVKLNEDDVDRLLDEAVINGGVSAIKLWYDRHGKQDAPEQPQSLADELAARRAQRAA